MLKRLYVDNFRCLVNFKIEFDRLNLLLGENGSGKTTVFEVIYRIRQFLSGNCKVRELLPPEDITRWSKQNSQRFQLMLTLGEETFFYALVVEHSEDRRETHVSHERLEVNEKPLLIGGGQGSVCQLYDEKTEKGTLFHYDSSRSGVGTFGLQAGESKMGNFCAAIDKIIVASIQPGQMDSESKTEDRALGRKMENFTAWYRFISQENQGHAFRSMQELKNVLPGFDSFNLKTEGEKTKVLKVMFNQSNGTTRSTTFNFSELSDGQRVLIALYTLLYGLKDQGYSLFLDEPENFLALREIQPWLFALMDECGHGVEQAVLISHHPELIDLLAAGKGRWFDRDNNGPVRVKDKLRDYPEENRTKPATKANSEKKTKRKVPGIKLSERVARGWA